MAFGKSKQITSLIISLLLLFILVFYPKECAEGIKEGLNNSGKLIIPSLFPYMLLSSFILRTRALKPIERVISPLTMKIFDLPRECTSAIIMSFIGGFPVGAKCVSILYKQKTITSEQAQRMMYFCICSGPSFLITGIGTIMLHNYTAGMILYISQLISGMIIGISVGLYSRIKRNKKCSVTENKNTASPQGISDSFISAAEDSAVSIIIMTALICFFSMLISVYKNTAVDQIFGTIRELRTVIPIFTEVTNGIISVKDTGLSLWWYSAAVGFGGMCVHFQIKLLLKEVPFSFIRYLIFRFINCFLSVIITKIICQLFVPYEETFIVFDNTDAQIFSAGIAGSTAMIIMCMIFLLSLRKRDLTRKLLHINA